MKKKIVFSIIAGVILSVVGFYFAMRNVPFEQLVDFLKSINYWWMVPASAIGLFTFVLRAFRWQVILSTSRSLPFFAAFHPMMIGFMINTVLPGRVGELARPAIIKKQDDVPFSLGLTTVAAERILDLITLIVLFAWVLAAVDIDPMLQIEFRGYQLDKQTLDTIAAGMVRLCVAVVIFIIAISIPAVQRVAKAGIMKLPSLVFFAGDAFKEKMREKCCIPLTGVLDNIVSGFSLSRYPVKLLICLFYSFAIWLLQAFALYIMTFGSPGIGLSFTQMTTVFIVICFFIALPSVPGFWGVWEAGGVFGMALFAVPAHLAAGFSLATHAVLMFPVLIAGIVSAVITGINIVQISYGQEPLEQEIQKT